MFCFTTNMMGSTEALGYTDEITIVLYPDYSEYLQYLG